MRIPQFSIANLRSIRLAACDQTPRIMIITGPNGCGKSTLLDALRGTPGSSGLILYVGPHRISGRQQVRMRYLAGDRLLMRDLQANNRLPSYEGITIHSRARSAWDFDETSSYLKYAMCQIELDRQAAITERFDKKGMIEKDSMPDIWMPLKGMTENLLPHLHFDKIDVSDRDHIKCLWNVHANNIQVDIDDLSSGEKAIIHLFFPLIENRIQTLITQSKDVSENTPQDQSVERVCVLMDEPELHLHPNLQVKILDYLRNLAAREHVQFVLATHSSTIVEQASSDELFLLRPPEMVGVEENQLIRIASDEEKLKMMREVFGSTSNITAMRTILVVEGRKADNDSKVAADEKILSFLSDRFAQITILAGGSKDQCKVLAQNLSEILSDELSSNLRAYALVDRDLESGASDAPHVNYLPVSMVENLLVDPEVIWKAIDTVCHKTTLTDQSKVEAALNDIIDNLSDHEIDRRIKSGVGFHAFRLHDPVSTAREQVEKHIKQVEESTSESAIDKLRTGAKKQIAEIQEGGTRRENYDGKKILDKLYRKYLHNSGMSKEIFVYECAKAASERKLVKRFVKDLLDSITGTE